MRRIKRETDRAENDDSTDEKSQLKTGGTELEFLSAYEIEPAYSGDQANETTRRDPRLRRESGWERNREIIDHRGPPRRWEKPTRGQERDRSYGDKRSESAVRGGA